MTPAARGLLLLALGLALRRGTAASLDEWRVPVEYPLPPRKMECAYERFEAGDVATFSAFVIQEVRNQGGAPRATVAFEGPVAGPSLGKGPRAKGDKTLGWKLREAVAKFPNGVPAGTRVTQRQVEVDWTYAGQGSDKRMARNAIDKQKREAREAYVAGKEGSKETLEYLHKLVTMATFEPYEETLAVNPGWYRLCATAEYPGLRAEMEIRGKGALGGINPETGHVYTYDEWEMMEEDRLVDAMDDDDAVEERVPTEKEAEGELKGQVKKEDLQSTKAAMKNLNDVVMKIKVIHMDYNHKVRSLQAAAERNHHGMKRSNLFMTFVYVVITGFQVYTVRRWLLSSTLLGR